MADITDAEHGPDTFEARLLQQAQHLCRLRVERGNPSLRQIERRAQRICNGAQLPIATQSAAFNGKRFVSVDKVVLLVRTLMSWDADGEEIPAPTRTEPVLNEWRSRWRATAELRPTRRSTVARALVTERDDPTPTRVRATDPTNKATEAKSLHLSESSLARRAALHAMQAGELVLPPFRTGSVFAVAFSPDGTLLATATAGSATASRDGTVRLWEPVTRTPASEPLTGHLGPVYAVTFSPDGTLLATGGYDSTVRLWDPVTRTPVGEPLTGHRQTVFAVAFSPDGTLLATASRDGTVLLWDPATRTPVGQPITGHSAAVHAVAFSPDGTLLATASDDGTVRLWDSATRTPVGQPLAGHLGPVYAVAFSPDGTLLATASGDGTVRLWDPATRTPVRRPLASHRKPVHALAFSPDGTLLATASRDGTVRLWDPATRTPVRRPLASHRKPVHALAFSADGTLLATASHAPSGDNDGTVQLWPVPHAG